MSRTIRRKNAWNAHFYIEDRVKNENDLAWFFGNYPYDDGYCHLAGKYRGLTEKKLTEKLRAKYHGETAKNWNYNSRVKDLTKGVLRNKNKMELIEALQNGFEEDVLFSTDKHVKGTIRWFND